MADINATGAIRKYFGLVKDGQPVYLKQIDVDQDGEFSKDETMDANNNGQVEDEEAWIFLARHASRPEIKEYVDGKFTDVLLRDLEMLPQQEKLMLLQRLDQLARDPANIELFNKRSVGMINSVIVHSNSKGLGSLCFSILSHIIAYSSLADDLPPTRNPILVPVYDSRLKPVSSFVVPADAERGNSRSLFWEIFSFELGAHAFFAMAEDEDKYDLSLSFENLPYPVKQEKACRYYLSEFDDGMGSVLFDAKIFLFETFGVGAGFSWGLIVPEDDGDLAYVDAEPQLVGPLFELRIPFDRERDDDSMIEVGFFATYSPFWASNNVRIKNVEGGEYRIATISASSYGAGLYMRNALLVLKLWSIQYVDLNIEKSRIPGAENNANIYMSYSPWWFNVILLSWGLHVSDEPGGMLRREGEW